MQKKKKKQKEEEEGNIKRKGIKVEWGKWRVNRKGKEKSKKKKTIINK